MSRDLLPEGVRAEREARRATATRFAGNVLTIGEFLSWASRYLKTTRQGRLTADLILTKEAFDALPGDDVQRFTNSNGEAVYRKKVQVPGALTLDIRALYLSDEVPDRP